VGVKTFDDLFQELTEKARTRPEGSGTVAELDAGVHQIGKKIVEEAAEVWMAAEYEGDAAGLPPAGAHGREGAHPGGRLATSVGSARAHPQSATDPTRKQTT
jgi:hypothetical protein